MYVRAKITSQPRPPSTPSDAARGEFLEAKTKQRGPSPAWHKLLFDRQHYGDPRRMREGDLTCHCLALVPIPPLRDEGLPVGSRHRRQQSYSSPPLRGPEKRTCVITLRLRGPSSRNGGNRDAARSGTLLVQQFRKAQWSPLRWPASQLSSARSSGAAELLAKCGISLSCLSRPSARHSPDHTARTGRSSIARAAREAGSPSTTPSVDSADRGGDAAGRGHASS